MRVTEHLERAEGPPISFEIIPPRRGGSLDSLLQLVEDLSGHRPPFIDITSHAAEVIYEETPGGVQKRVKRKRPGTLGLCALVQNKFQIDAVPHVLCEGFTREESEDFLIELHYLGIDNVLAIRGDSAAYTKPLDHGRSRNEHASELISQIADMNKGMFLEDLLDASPTNFCIGAAGHPEKHFEAPNREIDVGWVKHKVEMGAEYIVTQMFFDNEQYFAFVEECRRQGITVPIIPGLKVLTTKRHLTTLPSTFHCDIPPALADEVTAAEVGHVTDVGVAWAVEQSLALLDAGVPSLHFYVMSNANAVTRVVDGLGR